MVVTPRPETLVRLTDVVFDKVMSVLRTPGAGSYELLADMLGRLDASLNQPLRMSATTPDSSMLLIKSTRIVDGDGGLRLSLPLGEDAYVFPDALIDFNGGSVSGGTVTTNGSSFTLPVVAEGEFVRMAAVYKAELQVVDVIFSDPVADAGDLEALVSIFARLDGTPVGYADLECVEANVFKSIGADTNVIKNSTSYGPTIGRFVSSGAGGAGGDTSFELQSILLNEATIKKGSIILDNQAELYANDNFVVDLSLLVPSAAINTQYYLYIDLTTLGDEISVGASDRKVFIVGSGNMAVLPSKPTQTDPHRYVPIASLKTNASGVFAAFENVAKRTHDTIGAISGAASKSYILLESDQVVDLQHPFPSAPSVVSLYLWDTVAETFIGLDNRGHVMGVDDEKVRISTYGLTLMDGVFLKVELAYFPTFDSNVLSLQNSFSSQWFQDDTITEVAHNMAFEAIKGYTIQEWNVAAGKIRNLDPGSLVKDFDREKFYLDWAGMEPSSALRYRLVAGSSPVVAALPIQYGGYTKFVGFGLGSYSSLADAVADAAPGDAILVGKSHEIEADENMFGLQISASNIRVACMPGVEISITGPVAYAVVLKAEGITLENVKFSVDSIQAVESLLRIEKTNATLSGVHFVLKSAPGVSEGVSIPLTLPTFNGSGAIGKVRIETKGVSLDDPTNFTAPCDVDVLVY